MHAHTCVCIAYQCLNGLVGFRTSKEIYFFFSKEVFNPLDPNSSQGSTGETEGSVVSFFGKVSQVCQWTWGPRRVNGNKYPGWDSLTGKRFSLSVFVYYMSLSR